MGLARSCKSEGVGTVISCTEIRRENAIENSKNAIQMQVRVQVWAQNKSNAVNSMGKLGALDTKNVSKWQSNDTQGATMHSGLLSKKDSLI